MTETPIAELAMRMKRQQSFTYEKLAIVAFKYFHELAKQQVIDADVLEAILKDNK